MSLRTGVVDQSRSFFIYADTSDAGPDQAARRKALRSSLVDVGNILYFDWNCSIHQYHLIVKDQLQTVDAFLNALNPVFKDHPGKYFASVAKIANYWRERVGSFIDTWEAMHGVSTDVNYRRYPLQVVAGRWGSIDAAEEFYLARGKMRLKPVLLAMLSSAMKATKPKAQEKDKADDLADDLDEREAYRIKMSKYSSGACAAVQSDLFWVLLRLLHVARGPLRHFFLWCQKYSNQRPLLKLVTGFADRIMDEFSELYNTFDSWFQDAFEEASAEIPEAVWPLLRGLCIKIIVTSAGSFEMRIRSLTKKSLVLKHY